MGLGGQFTAGKEIRYPLYRGHIYVKIYLFIHFSTYA
jgi:hypothetical protein